MTAPLITEAELSILRTGFAASGYRNVYRVPQKNCFIARVMRKGEVFYLGCHPRARDAAKAVILWYRQLLGPDWIALYQQQRPGRFIVALSNR